MRYQAKRKISFSHCKQQVRRMLLLLRNTQNRVSTYVLNILKSHYYSGNKRAKLLKLHSSTIYSMLIPKILNRSDGNFLICFAVFPAP